MMDTCFCPFAGFSYEQVMFPCTAFPLITPIARRLDLEIGPGFQIGRYRGLNPVVHALVPTDYIGDIGHVAIEAGTIFFLSTFT